MAVIDQPKGDPLALVSSYYQLGAPVVFVCNGSLQWWRQSPTRERPVLVDTIEPRNVATFFATHREDLSPQKVFWKKTIGRVQPFRRSQYDFVDAGLLPAVEAEVGHRLTARVESAIDALCAVFDAPLKDLTTRQRRWLLESTFYLLAGKLLHDKNIPKFRKVDLEDVDEVFRLVTDHYKSEMPPTIDSARQRKALIKAAQEFIGFRYLGHITADTLADVYEQSLIDPKRRKAFGTHSTPSYIVDWIVWNLLPWIEQIDQDDRHVFEPACGHAPFLVSAMRLLRFLLPTDTSTTDAHTYLQGHLHGLDSDDRAREVARLSLTLADVPNPNGWALDIGDMFLPNVLESAASKATILLSNPPFEEFNASEREYYTSRNVEIIQPGKTAELVRRTLPHLPEGAVFGLVLPQAILHSSKENARNLREIMVRDFQLLDVCLLNDKVFKYADHETALVLGRKTSSRAKLANRFTCQKVREDDQTRFAASYTPTTSTKVAQADVLESDDKKLWIPDLPNVWEWCEGLPSLEEFATVDQGLTYVSRTVLPESAFTFGTSLPKKPAGQKIKRGFPRTNRLDPIHRLPELLYMNLSDEVVAVQRGGTTVGKPQVVLNYIRASRKCWRWKAFIDPVGRPIESCFLAVRPTKDLPLEYLWAILNGPVANAYLYCHTMKRQNLKGFVQQIPVPRVTRRQVERVMRHVNNYLEEAGKPVSDETVGGLFGPPVDPHAYVDPSKARALLLRVDAEVLRLYEIPSMHERQLLDEFQNQKRPGLPEGVTFDRYYPSRFKDKITLHMYLSDAFAKRRISTGEEFMRPSERQRLNDLRSLRLTGALTASQAGELHYLHSLAEADAYVVANDAPYRRLNEVWAARERDAEKTSRVADAAISEQLRGGKRANNA